MIRKYASLESAQILDLKGSKTRQKTASLDKLSEFEDYRTEDGYLYARIRAISSRVNKNHDGWPSVELAGGNDVFDRHANKTAGFTLTATKEANYGFSTFLGKPVFVDHNNSNPDRARGVIVDAKLHVEDHRTAAHDPYYSSDSVDPEHMPPTWVELLLEVDAKSFPKLAKAIIDGANDSKAGIDGFSMGCDVEKSVCNICKNAAVSPDEFCNHVKLKGAHFDWINPNNGRKESKRSYENCYGIKFFEISAVFDPADETALVREVRAGVQKEAMVKEAPGHNHVDAWSDKRNRQYEHIKEQLMEAGQSEEEAAEEAARTVNKTRSEKGEVKSFVFTASTLHEADKKKKKRKCQNCGSEMHVHHGRPYGFMGPIWGCGSCGNAFAQNDTDDSPDLGGDAASSDGGGDSGGDGGGTTASWNSKLKTAEAPLPQSDMMTVPEYVDTMREEEVCPVCGSNMDEGHQCEVCGYVQPPEGLDNPDLDKAQAINGPNDQPTMDSAKDQSMGTGTSPSPLDNAQQPSTNNLQPFASVNSEQMTWTIHHPKLAGKINSVERPIRPDGRPGTNEPAETILSDQDKPVTNRTAASLIAAANQGETMSNARTAADAPTADTRADKRVDVEGVGGVMDASNEGASKADVQTNVDGKGGVMQDSNQEASSPDRKENLPTAGKDSDDAGFNKDKTTDDSGKTRTFPNTNEPNSAVTDKAFPTASQKQSWGEERAYPTEGGIDQGPASKGAQPADPVGKADDRIDVTQPVTVNNPQTGTDQWTGTDGNGVTRQQDPVTRVVDPNIDVKKSSIVTLFKIADTEVELGLITADQKYERIAELEAATDAEIQATAKVLAKVKTAGLRKNASTRQGGVGRMPSLRAPREASVQETDESVFW